MSRLLSVMFRGFVFLAVVACLSAVGLARLAPHPTKFRLQQANRHEVVNGYHFSSLQHLPRSFDRDTGTFAPLTFAGSDNLDCAAFSSWEDEEGQTQVVGRWVRRVVPLGLCEGYGLARFSFPGGEPLDLVPLEVMPVGRPCFVPGSSSSVVFSAGDGQLYRYAFERPGGAGTAQGEASRLTRLGWREETAGKAPIALNDPVWPSDERMGGRMIVSLTVARPGPNGRSVHNNQLWWLELNGEGTEVVRAGRLVRLESGTTADLSIEEGQANVTSVPGGGLALAYLSRRAPQVGWNLRMAPIELQDGTGDPTVREETVVTVVASRAHTSPIFSSDGQWVYTLAWHNPSLDTFERTAIPDAIRLTPLPRSHVALRTTPRTWN